MTKRLLFIVIAAALMLVGMAVPAAANGGSGHGGSGHGGGYGKALRICKGLYDTRPAPPQNPAGGEVTAYWVPLKYPDGVEDLAIQSLAGCVTTVRRGGNELPVPYTALSTVAINAQCRYLEKQGAVTYPYDFYGNPAYHARNRADCIFFLRSFHLGTLPPGPGTPE